jgi:hypothetical protein
MDKIKVFFNKVKATLTKIFSWTSSGFTKIILFVSRRSYLKTLLVFSFFTTVFSVLYFSIYTLSTGDDHFFHFRFAELMREKGLLESFGDFKSLYFSKMAQGNEYFVYYNFLFYLFIIPFTYIKPLFLGIKLYAIITSSIAFTILYWCIRNVGVRFAFLWTIVLCSITGSSLMFRFFLSRPYILAPALLLLLIYCLHKKKYWAVFMLNLVYLYWHSATFYMSFGVSFVYYIFEKFYGSKGDWRNLVFALLGTLVGILSSYTISVGFLYYIYDIIFGVYIETVLGQVVNLPEGGELYKADLFDFMGSNPLLVPIFILTIVFFVYKYIDSKRVGFVDTEVLSEPRKHLNGAAFFLAISFFLGTVLISKRFQDFFVFFGGFFIVLTFEEVFSYIKISNRSVYKAIRVGTVIVFMYLFIFNILSLQTIFSNGASPEKFEKVGNWLDKNVPEGEVVFYPTWNWFPQIYYHSPKHNYIAGLEPRFLYVYSPALYWKWTHISNNGYVCDIEECPNMDRISKFMQKKDITKKEWYKKAGDAVANTIQSDFKSSYVVTSKQFANLNTIMDNNDSFEKVFSDQENLLIYKIVK